MGGRPGGENETTVADCVVTELIDSGPQRPHESLVWAIFYSHPDVDVHGANCMLAEWHRRWPESDK